MWKGLNPLMTLYTHDRPMFMGHVIYGGLLGRFPRYLEGLSGETMPPPAAGS
jgi:hypothetical protein